jgi:nitrous oxide reductase accessory protein NosL
MQKRLQYGTGDFKQSLPKNHRCRQGACDMRPNVKLVPIILALTLTVFALSGFYCWAGEPAKGAPVAAARGPSADGRLQIGDQDRCPVCGMFPAKRPKSAAALQLTDGRAFYFCGNGCLLRSWYHSTDHLAVDQDAIASMVVLNYFTGKPLDAHKAWWVSGSDVVGPMGPALVTLQTRQEVDVFQQRHGGRKIFQLGEMDEQLWLELFPSKTQ